jgi:hypothetical protein
MEMKGRALSWAACALYAGLVSGRPVHADGFAALYAVYWAGLPAAEIRLESRSGDGRYQDTIEIRSTGLPRLLTRFHGTARSEGRLAAGPARYDTTYDLRKRYNSHISMRFVERGGAIIAERGADDTSRKPPLAEEFRRNVVDPLTAFERIRGALRNDKAAAFTVPVYDGARRFDVQGQIAARASDGRLRVRLTLRPIAGFKGETSEDGDPDDAPRPVELTVTDDTSLVPLSMTVSLYYLPLVVQLVRLCPADDACSIETDR